jgi:hypothetical protein
LVTLFRTRAPPLKMRLIFEGATGTVLSGSINRAGVGMKALKYLIVVSSALALNMPAFAATVTAIEGDALQVNTGSGFHKVSGSAQVAPGGSVMVGPGGKGEILYSDGCRTPVTPGSLSVVAPVSPCAQGQAYGGYQYQDNTWYYLGGAALIGAGIGIGCAIWCGERHTDVVTVPVSP